MEQFVGINPATGLRVFVDSTSTVRLEIPVCPCCGGENLLSHQTKFGGQLVCKSCGDKWAAYLSAKSRINVHSSYRVLNNQLARINYWLVVKDGGGLAPTNLEQEKANIENYLSFCLAHDANIQRRTHEGHCPYCGGVGMLPNGVSKPRCTECEDRYKHYRYLQTHLGTLTIEECDEFHMVLNEYADLLRKGYWAPDIPKYREKIRRRLDELL